MERSWHAFYSRGLAACGEYPAIPVWGLLERAARERGGKVALVDGEERFTYADLWGRALEVAGWLHAHGVRPGDRVGLRLENSADFVTAYYGALRAGAIVVAFSPSLGGAELEAQRVDAAPRVLLTEDALPGAGPPPEVAPGETAVLQYTSGTTGRSKAAVLSHRNLVCNALQNARWFAWTADEVNLANLPLFHSWGMCVCLNSTFAVQGTLVLARGFDVEATFDLVERHRVTVLYGSATMFHRLLDVADGRTAKMRSLRHVKPGAMLTQGPLKARWDALFPHAPLQQGYGLTEASPETHNNPPDRFKPGTVGVPMQDTDCKIVDPDDPHRTLPPGEAGEVCLCGPQVARGYWQREEETAAAFRDGWLRTGDLGVMDDEGYLTIVDRLKDMLKFRGYTVSPNAVEQRLLEHVLVKEACVIGRPDERDGDVPTACVVLSGEATDAELIEHCRAVLAPYEVPRAVVRLDAIPRNRLGKPLRRELRDSAP